MIHSVPDILLTAHRTVPKGRFVIHWLLTLRIDSRAFLITLDAVAAILFVYLLLRTPRRWMVFSLAAAVLGAAVGLLVSWLVSDVWDVFGVAFTNAVRLWVTLSFAGFFLAVANLWASRWWRKTIAGVAVLVFVLTAAAGINVDFGAYRNLSDAMELTPYSTFSSSELTGHSGAMDTNLASTWHEPPGMATHGRIGMVTIPGTQSQFPARNAVVYLPPAALVANPPKLPVVVVFSGQPGTPTDMFTAGQMGEMLDSYAAKHSGLAPIVVAPDQLGNPLRNPMCVDSPLGNVSTYITVDVPNWIRHHLNVAPSSRYWAVAGYSEGGTCAIQFGAGHPNLFGSILDILGEVQPTMGASTVAKAFGGSQSAYDAAKPLTILAKNAPYDDSVAIFGEGATDQKYIKFEHQVATAASRAGMKTSLVVSPNTGHDWNSVRFILAHALPGLCARLGLGS